MSKAKTETPTEEVKTSVTFKVVAEGGVHVRPFAHFSSEPDKILAHGDNFEAVSEEGEFVQLVDGGFVYNAPYTIQKV